MDWLVYPIGDFLVWSFGILEVLDNLPNNIFIIIGFILMFVWLKMQAGFNKEAANNPSQLK